MNTLYTQRDPNEWQAFVELLKQALAEDKAEAFFEVLFTPDERTSLGLRVGIIQALLKNSASQREIQQQLNTSLATITRASNVLKQLDPANVQWFHAKLNPDGKTAPNGKA